MMDLEQSINRTAGSAREIDLGPIRVDCRECEQAVAVSPSRTDHYAGKGILSGTSSTRTACYVTSAGLIVTLPGWSNLLMTASRQL